MTPCLQTLSNAARCVWLSRHVALAKAGQRVLQRAEFALQSLIAALALFLPSVASDVKAQTNFDYYYLEAEKCRLAEDFSSAMDLYRHCLDINPEAPEALYNMGLLYLYMRSDSLGTAYIRRAGRVLNVGATLRATAIEWPLNNR